MADNLALVGYTGWLADKGDHYGADGSAEAFYLEPHLNEALTRSTGDQQRSSCPLRHDAETTPRRSFHDEATAKNERGTTTPQLLPRDHRNLYRLCGAVCPLLRPEPGADERRAGALLLALSAWRAEAELARAPCGASGPPLSLCSGP